LRNLSKFVTMHSSKCQNGLQDNWVYISGDSFSSQKAYKSIIGQQPIPQMFTSLWNSSCQAEHKFFF
jgi:hypothetical protein